ncbi:MAG TPA: hypothetical protein VFA15_09870, partial [Nitrososphaera sp.]|nr:hypothetical protein [Nitrososphaera sp.]
MRQAHTSEFDRLIDSVEPAHRAGGAACLPFTYTVERQLACLSVPLPGASPRRNPPAHPPGAIP